MDLDYEIIDDRFETLFTKDSDLYFAPSANLNTYYTNSIMAGRPGNTFWLEVLEEMTKSVVWYKSIGKHFAVMNSTGPIMLSRLIYKIQQPFTVIPSTKVTPCSVCNLNCNLTDSYIRPLPGSSWVAFDTKIYEFCMCHFNTYVLLFILIFILLLIILYWLYRNSYFTYLYLDIP